MSLRIQSTFFPPGNDSNELTNKHDSTATEAFIEKMNNSLREMWASLNEVSVSNKTREANYSFMFLNC